MGAYAAFDFHAKSQYLAIGVKRELGAAALVASVVARQELLAARGSPVNRSLKFARGVGTDTVFRIKLGFHAEAAANITDANPHLIFRSFQYRIGERVLQAGRILATGPERDAPAFLVKIADAAARLHCHRHQPLIMQRQPGHVFRPGKTGIGFVFLAELRLGGNIARRTGPDLRRILRFRLCDRHDSR